MEVSKRHSVVSLSNNAQTTEAHKDVVSGKSRISIIDIEYHLHIM